MKVLTLLQYRLLNFFKASELSNHFYFTGGTALSTFYLEHRYSYDLDFFTAEREALNLEAILKFLNSLPGLSQTRYEKIYDRRLFFLHFSTGVLKVEFTFYPFKQIAKPKVVEGLVVDSLEDIFVNKLCALCDRNEDKDLIDVYFILKYKGLGYLLWGLKKVKEKFGIDGAEYIIQRRLITVPKELENLPYLIKPISGYRDFLKKAVVMLAKEYWQSD